MTHPFPRRCINTLVVLALFVSASAHGAIPSPVDESLSTNDDLVGYRSKGGGANLEIASILLRVEEGDSGSAPVVHNPSPGQSLRPQVYYDASNLPTEPVHFIRVRLDGESICEGEISTDNGIRRVTCPAIGVPAGSFTLNVELDVENQIAESNEGDNQASRTYSTSINDPLDLDAVFVGMLDASGAPVATVVPGDEVFIEFVFDVEQAINYYWRAELRMNGERVCGFFNFRPDPDGSRRDVSCSSSIIVPSEPFTISGFADYRFEQSEVSESNNEAVATITPTIPPDPDEVRVDVLQLPFFCCVAPPPATQLGAVVSSNGRYTAVGEPFFFDGRIAAFTVVNGVAGFDDLVFAPEGFRVDNFGSAVAVTNDIMVVGAPVFEPVSEAEKGGLPRLRAALFERVGQGWSFKQPIDPGNSQEDDQFGFSVDIDGSMIVIGAPSDAGGETPGQGSGAVYLFEFDGNSLSMIDKVKPEAAQSGQGFGAAVAAKADKIAVGSPFSSVGSAVTGSASLYDLVGNNLMNAGTVTGSGSGDGDMFGITIDLAGDMMIVGAPENDAAGNNVGAAFVFDAAAGLQEMGRLTPNDPVPNARFGSAVSTDGIASVVGAPGGISEVGNNGAIYRFMGMTPDLKIPSPGGLETPLQGFGASIDLAGSRLAVGAPETNEDSGGAAMVSGLPDTSFSGPWFNAQQSGHGWFIEHLVDGASESINAYWYVYLDGEAVWLVGQGPLVGTSAQLQMFITDGARFPPAFNSGDVNLRSWGTLNFNFTTPTVGSASWTTSFPGFSSGSLQMEKIARVPASSVACRSGSYYNAQQSGHGFVVQVLDVEGSAQALVAWYVYDANGNQVWLLGQGPITNDEVNLTLFRFTGADFPPNFVTGAVESTPWGTLVLRFTGDDNATATWSSQTSGFGSGNLNLIRLTTLKGRGC